MDQDNIIRRIMLFQLKDAIAYGILPVFPTGYDRAQFCYIKLAGISPEYRFPTFDTDHADCVDIGMVLECLQSIDNHRFLIHS